MLWLRESSELHVQPLLCVALEQKRQQRSDPRVCLLHLEYFGCRPPKVIYGAIGYSGNCSRDEKRGCCRQPANEHRLGGASKRWRTGKATFDITKSR